ncbi:hypothetical protein ACKKBG_A16490 [Auxenochlorella protothecoides x Auxenochlorella symbiontica]
MNCQSIGAAGPKASQQPQTQGSPPSDGVTYTDWAGVPSAQLSTGQGSWANAPDIDAQSPLNFFTDGQAYGLQGYGLPTQSLQLPSQMEEADRNSASGPGNKTLYLGNLHPFISEAMLHDVFAGCRGVLELKIIKDKATGIPAGYGFAKFVDAISAQEGLDLVGKPVLFGQEVRINWAFQKEQREELGNHVHVFVGDLAADVTDAMLAAAFEVYPGCSDARVMWDHASGRSRGYGFVSFATKAQAEAAIQGQHGQTIGSRRVRCGWAQHKVGESAAPVDAAVLDRSDPTNTNVYVGNLDVALTDSEIRRHFSSFGALAEMKLHRKGAYGFVRFRSHADAVRAIVGSNAQPLGSKVLKCSWGRHPSLPPSGLHSHLLLATGAGLNPMLPLALSAPAPGMVSGGLGSGLVNPMLPALPPAMNHSLLPPYQPPVVHYGGLGGLDGEGSTQRMLGLQGEGAGAPGGGMPLGPDPSREGGGGAGQPYAGGGQPGPSLGAPGAYNPMFFYS